MGKTQGSPGSRSIKVDDRLASVEQSVRSHEHALEIQFQRIAQIQADIDTLRAAVFRTDTHNERPDETQRPLFVPYIPDK